MMADVSEKSEDHLLVFSQLPSKFNLQAEIYCVIGLWHTSSAFLQYCISKVLIIKAVLKGTSLTEIKKQVGTVFKRAI